MKLAQSVFCAGALLCATLTASAQTFDFNKDKAGGPPKGFSTELTSQGRAGVWVVTKDDSAPDRGNVLAQTDAVDEGRFSDLLRRSEGRHALKTRDHFLRAAR